MKRIVLCMGMVIMKRINCNLIVAGPATGKTYLALNDKRFVDLDGARAAYKYGFSSVSELEFERSKGARGEVVNKDSLQYIIKMIDEVIKDKKVGLLSYHEDILEYVWKNNIPYCLVYASFDSREEYIERMEKRGNSLEFIKNMTDEDIWKSFYEKDVLDTKATYKIELGKGQYLFDIRNYF